MSWGPASVCLLRWQITCWRNNFSFFYWILYFPVHLKIFEKQLQTLFKKRLVSLRISPEDLSSLFLFHAALVAAEDEQCYCAKSCECNECAEARSCRGCGCSCSCSCSCGSGCSCGCGRGYGLLNKVEVGRCGYIDLDTGCLDGVLVKLPVGRVNWSWRYHR